MSRDDGLRAGSKTLAFMISTQTGCSPRSSDIAKRVDLERAVHKLMEHMVMEVEKGFMHVDEQELNLALAKCPRYTLPTQTQLCQSLTTHVLSPELNQATHLLLHALAHFQHRLLLRDPLRARVFGRRVLTGLKETIKAMQRVAQHAPFVTVHSSLLLVIIAMDIEAGAAKELNSLFALQRLCLQRRSLRIPIVFAGTRRTLGRACHLRGKASCVAVLNISGAEDTFKSVQQLFAQASNIMSLMKHDHLLFPPH